jgi:hypothetical protein
MLTDAAQNFQVPLIVQAITKNTKRLALRIFEIFDPRLRIRELGR